jgi:protein ImuB
MLEAVLVEQDRGALRIAALDPAAMRGGLRAGMALAEARALWPDLDTAQAEPEADAAFMRHLGELCDLFTPLVALNASDGLILDVTGCAHLFGGEREMVHRVRHRLGALGLASCAAISGTPHAAWALARDRRNAIVAAGEEEQIARTLPLTVLEQDPATVLALGRAGFQTLGDLADRPSGFIFFERTVNQDRDVLGGGDVVRNARHLTNNLVGFKNREQFANCSGNYETSAHKNSRISRCSR